MIDNLKKYEYYRTDMGVLYHGDCLEIMPHLPKVDLVLTDPPYGAEKFTNDKLKLIKSNIKKWALFITEICRKQLFVFCDYRSIHYWMIFLSENKKLSFRNIILWHKELGGSSKRYYPRKTEYILWYVASEKYTFSPKKIKCSSQMLKGKMKNITDLWEIPSINNMAKERIGHPTQKPIYLIEQIIVSHGLDTEKILDPFLGSGTTAVACERLNRHWIGIEIEEKYCEIAAQRIENERKQRKLF